MSRNTARQLERGLIYERVRLAYTRMRARATGGWVLREGPVEVCACPFIDLFNGLMSPAWPEDETEDFWRRALLLYRRTGQGMFVSFGPSSVAGSLQERIRRDGFHETAQVPFMSLDLAELKEHPAPEGVRIERILDFSFFERQEHPWLGPVGSPYRKRKLAFLRQSGEGDAPCLWQFIALHQRRIVGAATVFSHEDEVAVFDVFVAKSHRKRGIGAGLMSKACAFARSQGMRGAGLSASGHGVKLYRKLGFIDAGCYRDFFLSRDELMSLHERKVGP